MGLQKFFLFEKSIKFIPEPLAKRRQGETGVANEEQAHVHSEVKAEQRLQILEQQVRNRRVLFDVVGQFIERFVDPVVGLGVENFRFVEEVVHKALFHQHVDTAREKTLFRRSRHLEIRRPISLLPVAQKDLLPFGHRFADVDRPKDLKKRLLIHKTVSLEKVFDELDFDFDDVLQYEREELREIHDSVELAIGGDDEAGPARVHQVAIDVAAQRVVGRVFEIVCGSD